MALLVAAPGLAQSTRFMAFGDSITHGDFDDNYRVLKGYPPRLEKLLAAEGVESTVANRGVGGETSVEGLARIDSVLREGGDVLLLMEGTNDISRRISQETILFDLDEMARRAEERGMVAVHATPIPRAPDAERDADNARTGSLAAALRTLATERGRGLVDPFAVFSATEDVFDRFYYPGSEDPVGHPNGRGYDLLAETFLPGAVAAAAPPPVSIEVASAPVALGQAASFSLVTEGSYEEAYWELGDGGAEVREAPGDLGVTHLYLAPGVYDAAVTVMDRLGRTAHDATTVAVVGDPRPVVEERSFVQNLLLGPRGDTGTFETDLWLFNAGSAPASVALELLERGHLNPEPEERSVTLLPGRLLHLPNVAERIFRSPGVIGALGLAYRHLATAGGEARIQAFSRTFVELPDRESGTFGQRVPEEPEAGWSAAERSITGILEGDGFAASLLAANLDDTQGVVTAELTDAIGEAVGTADLDLGARGIRLQRLDHLFPAVADRSGPFTVVVRSGGIRFTASVTLLELDSEDQIFLPAGPSLSADLLVVPRVVRGGGLFDVRLTTSLAIRNPSPDPSLVTLELWERGRGNLDAPWVTVTLDGGETVWYPDLLPELFGREEATGALVVRRTEEAAPAPEVTTLMFAHRPEEVEDPDSGETHVVERRFGMAVDTVTPEDAVVECGVIFGLEQDAVFRSSLGVVNLAPGPTALRLSLRDPEGHRVAAQELELRPLQHLERNMAGIFTEGPLGPGPWSVEVEVGEGGPVLPYLAKVNVSGDILMMPAREE